MFDKSQLSFKMWVDFTLYLWYTFVICAILLVF